MHLAARVVGRVALPRDRRCTSAKLPFVDFAPPLILSGAFFPLADQGAEHADPLPQRSATIHDLCQNTFLQLDKDTPGVCARSLQVHRRFEDQLATFHNQDPVG